MYIGNLIVAMLGVVCVRRRVQTRINALVDCVFDYLAEQHPDRFEARITKKVRAFYRNTVMLPWKFCHAIDCHDAGSLNLRALNVIRSEVEELPSNTIGVIPHGSTVANSARKLEMHAEEAHQMHIYVEKTSCGPCYWFDFDITIRLLMNALGLDKHAATGGDSEP